MLQARQLVELICHPDSTILSLDEDDEEDDQDQHIEDVLQNMDQWSLRVSWLELQVMGMLEGSAYRWLCVTKLILINPFRFQKHSCLFTWNRAIQIQTVAHLSFIACKMFSLIRYQITHKQINTLYHSAYNLPHTCQPGCKCRAVCIVDI